MTDDFEVKKHSKRHHYLPVFYLKGFSDNEQLIHIFDKKDNEFLPIASPKSKFYKNNLNNFVFDNQIKFTYEETFYTPLDTQSSTIFNKIRNLTIDNNADLNNSERFDLLWFITHLYWRSPYSNSSIEEIVKNDGFSNKYFHVKNKQTGQVLSDNEIPEIIKSVLIDKQTQKIFKAIYPLLDSNINEIIKLLDNWHLFYLNDTNQGLITGDMPIITLNENFSLNQIFKRIVFPISKHRLLIINENAPKFFETTLLHTINACIFHQAKRFVCSDDKELLNTIIDDYKRLQDSRLSDDLVEKLYGMVNFQSKFETFDEYNNKIMKNNNR
jgi:hypothetical protein